VLAHLILLDVNDLSGLHAVDHPLHHTNTPANGFRCTDKRRKICVIPFIYTIC